jgi:hypothetical protein
MRWWGRVVVAVGAAVLGALVLVAGCAQPGNAPASVPSGAPEVHPSWTNCESHADTQPFGSAETLGLPRLGSDFAAVAAVVCDSAPQEHPDGSSDLVATESRAENITDLLTALRLPDKARPLALACTDDLPIIPWLGLLDASGRWIRPGAPMDECGKIRVEVRDAVRALTLTVVSSRTIREIVSKDAAAAGCTGSWADMISVEAAPGARSTYPPFVYPFTGTPQLRLCVYTVAPEEQGSGKPAGNFGYGGLLTAIQQAGLAQALGSLGPVRPCAGHASRFALIRPADNAGATLYAELDGCQRVMADTTTGPGFGQGDPALAALLAKS